MNKGELYLTWLERTGCENNEQSYQEFDDQLSIEDFFDKAEN